MPRTYTTAADAAADGWLPAKRVLRSSPELIALAETIRQHGGEGVIGISDTSGPRYYGYSFEIAATVFYPAPPGGYPYYPAWYSKATPAEQASIDADAAAWEAADFVEKSERRVIARTVDVFMRTERNKGGSTGAFAPMFHAGDLRDALIAARAWITQTLDERAAEMDRWNAERSAIMEKCYRAGWNGTSHTPHNEIVPFARLGVPGLLEKRGWAEYERGYGDRLAHERTASRLAA